MPQTNRVPDIGFHAGELAVQRRAGVEAEAARLSALLEPVDLSGGITKFLAARTFAALTARENAGRLWVTPLIGPPGFLAVVPPTSLVVYATMPPGDPLHGLPVDQRVGMIVVEFASRRRVRINGILAQVAAAGFALGVEQAYGNCPQYIQQRVLGFRPVDRAEIRRGPALAPPMPS
jgi:predicted pyridoxine 5'-phosphate oxidase superfamily flavin-nucleotide-binding protein